MTTCFSRTTKNEAKNLAKARKVFEDIWDIRQSKDVCKNTISSSPLFNANKEPCDNSFRSKKLPTNLCF